MKQKAVHRALFQRVKKAGIALLAGGLVLAGMNTYPLKAPPVQAINEHVYPYFYEQLNDAARKLYDAMVMMADRGVFLSGDDFSLSANGYVSQEQLKSFTENDQTLLNDFGAARDAFMNDYPDLFYIDFSYLTLKVTKSASGHYYGYLGKGRADSYFYRGFTKDNVASAVDTYENTLNNIVAQANQNGETAKEKAEYVHHYLVKHMIYRYEDEVTNGNARTAYDGLVYGEGVCEAYTRAYKAIMDRLGIPCVCVYGVYQVNDTQSEEHIWNEVQIDGEWYAMDCTMDDPIIRDKPYQDSGSETDQYMLAGEVEMAAHHIQSGYMSGSGFCFEYPAIAVSSLRESVYVDDDNGFKYRIVEGYNNEDDFIKTGLIQVSYEGKNYTENAEEGKYILVRTLTYEDAKKQDREGEVQYRYTDWGYMYLKAFEGLEKDVETGAYYHDDELGDYINFCLPQIMQIQFAITDIPPNDSSDEEIFEKGGLYYQGNPNLLTIRTGEIKNIYGDGYIAPPYPKKVTPSMSGMLYIGNTYNVSVTYDDKLVPNGEPIGVELASSSADTGRSNDTGEIYAKIEDVQFDGDATVTFKFTPSMMFADDYCFYDMKITGLLGDLSEQPPLNITFMAGFRCAAYAYQAQGYDWNVFGQPQLLDTEFDTSGFEGYDEDGNYDRNMEIAEELTHRLTLVTTSPSDVQANQMEDYLSDDYKKIETYNIKLTLCKAQIVKTGDGLRVSIGFPEGYSYSSLDEGITFEAYHYITDENGVMTGEVEKIPITVTPYGLIILIKSFSPFAITAAESDGSEPLQKTLIVKASDGGYITDENGKVLEGSQGIISIAKGESVTLNIHADEGFYLSDLSYNDEKQDISYSQTIKKTFSYEDLTDVATIVNADFVMADDIIDEPIVDEPETSQPGTNQQGNNQQGNHQPDVNESVEPGQLTVTLPASLEIAAGETLTLKAVSNQDATWEWYRDDTRLENTSDTLTIKEAAAEDAGRYKAVATWEGHSAQAVCDVKVTPANALDEGASLTIYTVDEQKNFVENLTLLLYKLDNGQQVLIAQKVSDGRIIFENLADGEYRLYEQGHEDRYFTIIVQNGKILFANQEVDHLTWEAEQLIIDLQVDEKAYEAAHQSQQTGDGDTGMIIAYSAIALVTLGLMALLVLKKRAYKKS